MGFLLCAILWAVVLLEEIERIPPDEWQADGLKKVLLFRRTRARVAFILAFLLGAFFAAFEIRLIFVGRTTFNFVQAIGLIGILFGCYLFAVIRKGARN